MTERVFVIASGMDMAPLAKEVFAAMLHHERERTPIQFVMDVKSDDAKIAFEEALLEHAKNHYKTELLKGENVSKPEFSELKVIELPQRADSFIEGKSRRDIVQGKPWLKRRKEKW